MRMMLTVRIGAQAGNRAIKDGSLPRIMESFIRDFKPESAYFTTGNGDRTAYFVVDVPDAASMPPIAEPFFMGLDAGVDWKPVMTPKDLHEGLGRLPR
jgi:hypothetical protein